MVLPSDWPSLEHAALWSDLNRCITRGQALHSAGTIMARGAGVGPSPAAGDRLDIPAARL